MQNLPPSLRARVDGLKRELEELLHESRTELPAEMQDAQSVGPVRENAALYLAAGRAHYVQGRIALLQQRLQAMATLDVSRIPKDRAGYGSLVVLEDEESGTRRTLTLSSPEETSLGSDSCSLSSPLGRAILGRRVGDRVEVDAPSGLQSYLIVSLKTLHDQRGDEGS